MADMSVLKEVLSPNDNRIVLIVIDGLGGMPREHGGKTELEEARTPNLDRLTAGGVCGLSIPVDHGITPGSGPAHLALFGYDPMKHKIGRGVLEALGTGMELSGDDVCARANFATMDPKGIITDRRAGRIPTEKNMELCAKLRHGIKKVHGVDVRIQSGKEHRFVVVFRGEELGGDLTESDPQKTGRKALKIEARSRGSSKSASVINRFIKKANDILKHETPANTVLLRGLSKYPDIPGMAESFGVDAAAIATYPMYKGLASLVGMKVLRCAESMESEFEALKENFERFTFFYLHIKETDSAGEDGDFDAKVAAIEKVDSMLPAVESLKPEVMVITGDHSTPSALKGHSWHPVPFLLVSGNCVPDGVHSFSERSCAGGGLGHFYAKDAMAIMLAHALKLSKFGA